MSKRGPHVDVKIRALPTAAYARAHGISPVTVWRGIKAGRLKYIVINKRKLILLEEPTAA